MQVTKRDGRIVQFNKGKIIKALEQAFIDIDKELTDESKEKIETIKTVSEFSLTIDMPKNFLKQTMEFCLRLMRYQVSVKMRQSL